MNVNSDSPQPVSINITQDSTSKKTAQNPPTPETVTPETMIEQAIKSKEQPPQHLAKIPAASASNKTLNVDQAVTKIKQLPIPADVSKTQTVAQDKLTKQNSFVELDRGKAKIVLKRGSEPTKVYYQPVPSALNAKQKEIQEEVKTASQIKTKLYENTLKDLFKNTKLSSQEQANLTSALMQKYPDINNLIETLEYSKPNEGVGQYLKETLNITNNAALTIEEFMIKTTSLAILKARSHDGDHLALQMKEIAPIEGKYTVETDLATGNLEKEIRKRPADFGKLFNLGGQFISGMKDLHSAGFVQGDLKPENILIYPTTSKLSDWGKTRQIGDQDDHLYTGNPRFAPPELRLSKPGEVYSSALILIRILEEAVLDSPPSLTKEQRGEIDRSDERYSTGMLVDIPANKKDPAKTVKKERRGIEKFLCLNKSAIQAEITNLVGTFKIYGKSVFSKNNSVSLEKLKKSEQEVKNYINQLIIKLGENKALPPESLEDLQELLTDMTAADPKQRPTMEQVKARYQAIQKQLSS